MLSVGHFHYCFFERSETFIYNQLVSLKKYKPVAVSLVSRNLDRFNLTNGVLYDVGIPLPRPSLEFLAPFRYSSLKLAAELFRRENVSLLHVHFGTWGAYALPLAKTLRVPMVVTFYGQDVSLLPQRTLWRNRYQKLWKKADLILAEGPHMIKELLKLGASKNKVALQRIGIPLSQIHFCAHRTNTRGNPKALWAGRMVEKKGLIDALEALKLLRREGIKLELRVIGDGPEKPLALAFVRENNLSEYVRFLGFLDYQGYLTEFEKADFFLAPSRTSSLGETEGGAPTTVLEAQARGLPVVATRHADIPFILPSGYPYLAQEGNPEDLARVIEKLLADRKLWLRIARDGRRYVERFHGLKVTVPSLEKYYDLLLKRK